MKITHGGIVSVEAERLSGTEYEGFDVNIKLTDIKESGKNLEVHYTHTADYKKNFARMMIKGVVVVEADEKEKKKITEEWKKTEQAPTENVEDLLMAINYATSAVGTLLAFSINIAAPINIPRPKLLRLPGEPATQQKAS